MAGISSKAVQDDLHCLKRKRDNDAGTTLYLSTNWPQESELSAEDQDSLRQQLSMNESFLSSFNMSDVIEKGSSKTSSEVDRCVTPSTEGGNKMLSQENVTCFPGLSPIPNMLQEINKLDTCTHDEWKEEVGRTPPRKVLKSDTSTPQSTKENVANISCITVFQEDDDNWITSKNVQNSQDGQDEAVGQEIIENLNERSASPEEEDNPWDISVYVPRTPKTTPRASPSKSTSMKSASRSLENDSTFKSKAGVKDVTKHTPSPVSRSIRKLDLTTHGLSLINWDESLMVDYEIIEKISPASIPFSERFQQKLLDNSRKIRAPVCTSAGAGIPQTGGPFFGLPVKVKELIQTLRGISNLYEWQEKCLSMPEVQERHNLVYALPTSGGKTLVAEILLLKEILVNRKNTLFILPYVSIVQEKVRALAQLAIELDFSVEEYAAGKGAYPPRKRRSKNSVYVATIEKALGLVHSLLQERRLHEIGLVIVDELHLLGEGSRGATLETVLTKLLYAKEEIQIIGMSATIGNLNEVAAFLNAKTFTEDFRPVELHEYIKCGSTIFSVNRSLLGTDESPLGVERIIDPGYTQQQLQSDPDLIAALVMETVPQESVLVFCPSRKNCENVALLICQTIGCNDLMESRVEEKKALFRALAAEGNGSICQILKKTLPYGVAYHHSGLTTAERRLLEEAFLAKTICVICCTSTLAAGVNLPARRVILRSPYIGTEFIDLSRYKQMIGRAGRAGFGGEGESVMMCHLKDTQKVVELLTSSMNESLSCLAADNGAGMKALVLSAISLKMATCRADIHKLVRHTLLWVQADKLGVPVTMLADRCIQELVSEGGFCISNVLEDIIVGDADILFAPLPCNNKKQECKSNIPIYQQTQLKLTRVGEAAVRGGLTMNIAHRLYDDLRLAQGNLVLLNYMHLLYVVTPYTDLVKPVRQVYFNVFMELSSTELKVANALGITEAVAMAIMKGKTSKSVRQEVLDRFYLTLILHDLWHERSIWQVSTKFQVSRGQVYSLLTSASAFASCVLRFTEGLSEFWCFKVLLEEFVQRLSHCCSTELLPLMELPAVKIGRARQLYNAGYRTLQDVARADTSKLVKELDHMPRRAAHQIVAAAKLLIVEKADALKDEAADYLEGLLFT